MEELITGDVFNQIVLVLAAAAVIGTIGYLLRQPLIVSFIVVGVLVGPAGLGFVEERTSIELLAKIGIALLLFIVGLRLDLHMIRTTGPVALATGLGQVIFTSAVGYLIAIALGMTPMSAAYVAVALTFSSTIIIIKLLSDKREIDSLHGRIAIGFLIVQDIVAIVAMIGLTAIGGGAESDRSFAVEMLWILLKGAIFLVGILLLMQYVLPRVVRWLAHYQELLILFSISWAVALAAVGEYFGFSKEVGAFLAGVSLASSDFRDAIGMRLTTLRDFLLLFFFIDLGAGLDLSLLGAQLPQAVLFSAFVLLGNPLIVVIIMGLMGYRSRTGFLAGLTVAQISEFSLILIALGRSLGHVSDQIVGLVTLVGIVTICGSTYMILYSHRLYDWLAPFLDIFERSKPHRELMEESEEPVDCEIILFGLGNYGGAVAGHLLERSKRILGVDFDPQALEFWRERGLPVVYGDAADPDLLDQLPIHRARWIVSSFRDPGVNLALLRMLKSRKSDLKIAVAARDEGDARVLDQAGADLILKPLSDAAELAADMLTPARYMLPAHQEWPVAVREVRLRPGSRFSGSKLADLALREKTGTSILAVSRAGRVHMSLEPGFRIYPGDHLILMGDPERIAEAEALLAQRSVGEQPEDELETAALVEIEVPFNSALVGQSIAELRLRSEHRVMVIAVRRGDSVVASPAPDYRFSAGDLLLLLGSGEAIEAFQRRFQLNVVSAPEEPALQTLEDFRIGEDE